MVNAFVADETQELPQTWTQGMTFESVTTSVPSFAHATRIGIEVTIAALLKVFVN